VLLQAVAAEVLVAPAFHLLKLTITVVGILVAMVAPVALSTALGMVAEAEAV
jgi:hypothetical protein